LTISYSVAYCNVDNKGNTIEVVEGNGQEIVDYIRDRRLSYGNVNIVYMHWNWNTQPEEFSVKLTYKIPTV